MAGDRTAIVAGGEGRNTPAAAHVASLALAGRASVASSLHRGARLATGSEHADGGGSDRVIPEARHAGMSNPAVSTPATSSPSESRYHTAEPARRSGSPTPSRSEARRPSCRNNSERGKAYRRWTSASIATREAPSGPMVYARAGAWIQNSSSRLSPTRFFASIPVEPDRAGLVVARIMDALLVELTRAPGSNVRVTLDLEGRAGEVGYPKDVVDIVKANARDLKIAENTYGFEV